MRHAATTNHLQFRAYRPRSGTLGLVLSCALMAVPLAGQIPSIGVIDFYGLQTVSEEQAREVLDVKEGERLPPSKSDLEERLEKIPGVVWARLEAVCCEAGKTVLYVGIEEKGAPHFDFRTRPNSNIELPEEIIETYRRFLMAFEKAAEEGDIAEDLDEGHSLMRNPACRALQIRFTELAATHVEILRDVLRESAHEQQRAAAAYVAGYGPKNQRLVDDLQYAIRDPHDSVRANAMRSLAAISVLASKEPKREIKVTATWFVEMLNSIIWTDRRRAAEALVNLTEDRNTETLRQLRERSWHALLEMASWKSLAHAFPAYILVGRAVGMSEKEIQDGWKSGNRMTLLDKAMLIEEKR